MRDCWQNLSFLVVSELSPAGTELSPDSSGRTPSTESRAAFLRAFGAALTDPGLIELIRRWLSLSQPVRSTILATAGVRPAKAGVLNYPASDE